VAFSLIIGGNCAEVKWCGLVLERAGDPAGDRVPGQDQESSEGSASQGWLPSFADKFTDLVALRLVHRTLG
jgi:hypothetical protein